MTIHKQYAEFLIIIILISCSLSFCRPLSVLCTDNNNQCFFIDDSASLYQFDQMIDTVPDIFGPCGVSVWSIYYLSGYRIIKTKILYNISEYSKVYSAFEVFVKSKKRVSVFQIDCNLDFFNKFSVYSSWLSGGFFQMNEKVNYSKVIADYDEPDTLYFGLIDRSTRKQIGRQLVELQHSYIPKKGLRLRDYLIGKFPSCLNTKYLPRGLHSTNDGNIVFEKGEIEALFPAGYPCEYIVKDYFTRVKKGSKQDIIYNIRCDKPDTLRLDFYSDKISEQKLSEILKNEPGFWGIQQLYNNTK